MFGSVVIYRTNDFICWDNYFGFFYNDDAISDKRAPNQTAVWFNSKLFTTGLVFEQKSFIVEAARLWQLPTPIGDKL